MYRKSTLASEFREGFSEMEILELTLKWREGTAFLRTQVRAFQTEKATSTKDLQWNLRVTFREWGWALGLEEVSNGERPASLQSSDPWGSHMESYMAFWSFPLPRSTAYILSLKWYYKWDQWLLFLLFSRSQMTSYWMFGLVFNSECIGFLCELYLK